MSSREPQDRAGKLVEPAYAVDRAVGNDAVGEWWPKQAYLMFLKSTGRRLREQISSGAVT